jgi:hypothetical protein
VPETAKWMIVLDQYGKRHYYAGGGPHPLKKEIAVFIDTPQYQSSNVAFLLDSAKAACFYSKTKAEDFAFQFAMMDKNLIGHLSVAEALWREPVDGKVSPGEIKLGVIPDAGSQKI